MKKIAIIAPCVLPVPACKGGAVEELITSIINQNEISKNYAIDLYTIAEDSYNLEKYSLTKIIPILLDKTTYLMDRICDKYYRTFDKSAKRIFDKKIISQFLSQLNKLEDSYYAVIVENQMSLAEDLIHSLKGSKDFPIYFHMHNDVDIYRTPEEIRILAENGVQFIAVSNYIKNQILKFSKEAKVHVLYNGIDFDGYSRTTKTSDEQIKILYAGRVIPTKGVAEGVMAFKRAISSLPKEYYGKVFLDIIGFSDKATIYEKKVLGLVGEDSNTINCIKRLPTTVMAQKYNEYDIVIMPTIDEEPFGLVALETIAKGIPLITTNSGAIPEVVEDGAIIVDKTDKFIDDLSEQMKILILNKDNRIALGKKAFDVARRTVEFDINTYYDRLVDILDTIYSQNIISVIVPVYNVENQLEKCIKSLISQTYTNIEIILVDDGSEDNSGIICDDYAKKDSRIRVIHQQNKGLSGARNSGLDIATGDYIFFVDSDDYLDNCTLQKLVEHSLRCKADVVACGISQVFDDAPDCLFTSPVPGIWSGKESVVQMMTTNNVCSIAWNKLYKSFLWEDIRFPLKRLHEDEATIYKILYKADIVAYIPDAFYKYYQRSNGIMNSGIDNRYEHYLVSIEERIKYFKEFNEDKLVDYSIMTLLQYIKYVYRNVENNKKQPLIERYNALFNKYGLPKSLKLKKKVALCAWKLIRV